MIERNTKPATLQPAGDSVDRAMAFYDAHLRAILEPSHDGEYVAIHPDSGEYAVERFPGRALRAVEAKHPTGPIIVRYIGLAGSDVKFRLRGKPIR